MARTFGTISLAAVLGLLVAACAAPEPQNPAAALLEEADGLRARGALEEAIPVYERAIELDPDLAPALLGLALAHSSLGNAAEAERFYLLADAKDPDDVQIKLNLAGFYYRGRDYDRALWALQKAMDIAPEGEEATLITGLWARVETAKVRATVRQSLLEALTEDPGNEETAARLADSYAKEAADLLQGGNAREALAVVQEGMETVPEAGQAELFYLGAQAHGATGDDETAFEWLDRAIELDDTVALYHLSRAGFLTERGELEEALAELDRVIELAPASEEAEFARIRRADIELRQQVPEESVEEYLDERRDKAPAKKKKGSGG